MFADEKTKTIFIHNPKTGGEFLKYEVHKLAPMEPVYRFWQQWTPEVNTDLGHINRMNLARFVPEYGDYKILVFVRNPYNRFISALKTTCNHYAEIRKIFEGCGNDVLKFLHYIDSQNYFIQDQFLRSASVPWLMPQSYYFPAGSVVLKYENPEDWQFALNVFGVRDAAVRIKEDYPVNKDVLLLLKKLYWDDSEIFKLYNL